MSKLYIIASFNFFTHIKTALIAAGPVETSENYAKTILREPLRIQRIIQKMQERGYQLYLIIPDETCFTKLLNGRALVEHYLDIGYGSDRPFLKSKDILSFNPDDNPAVTTTTFKVKLIEQALQSYNVQHPENVIIPGSIKDRIIVIDDDESFLAHMKNLGVQTRRIEIYPAHHDLRVLEEELGIILPKYNPEKIEEINKLSAQHKKQKYDFQYGEQRLEIERKLQTLIWQEWQYKIERDLIGLQLSVVEPWVEKLPTLSGLKEALSNYQQELKTIYNDSLCGFQGYVVSDRTHIFYNEHFIPMTKDNIKRIMDDFRQHLNQWFVPYQQFTLNLETNFRNEIHQLQQAFAKTDQAVENIMYEKSELALPIAFQEEDLKRQSNTNQAIKQSISDSISEIKTATTDHPFLQVCETGNLTLLKKHLPVFNKVDFINETRNGSGETAVHIACRRGDVELLMKLYALKANLDIPVQVLSQNQKTIILYHPLQWALKHQQLAIMQFLTRHTNINAQDNKYHSTILHTAVYEQNADAVQLLLKAGAIIDQTHADYQSWTPLHYAASKGNASLIKLLLEHYRTRPSQIQVTVKGTEGETALGVAIRWNQPRVAKLLLEYGVWLDNDELQSLKMLATKPGSKHILTIVESLLKQQLETLTLQVEPTLNVTQLTANLSLENSPAKTNNNNNISQSSNFTFFKEATSITVESKTIKEKSVAEVGPRISVSENEEDKKTFAEIMLDENNTNYSHMKQPSS